MLAELMRTCLLRWLAILLRPRGHEPDAIDLSNPPDSQSLTQARPRKGRGHWVKDSPRVVRKEGSGLDLDTPAASMIPPSPSLLPALLCLLAPPAAQGFTPFVQPAVGRRTGGSGGGRLMMSTTEEPKPVVPKVGAPMPEGTCCFKLVYVAGRCV